MSAASDPDARGVADDVPEQMRVRRAKRRRLLESGTSPYPLGVPRTHSLAEVRAAYDPAALGPDHRTGAQVAVAGRVVHLRDTGRLVFVTLREGGAELQAMFSAKELGDGVLEELKTLVDLGDHLAVQGEVVTSRRGELSVLAAGWRMAAKALRPLPNAYHRLSDEARTRMRYLDLIVRPRARETVRARAAALRSLRAALDGRGYLEVETPVLQLTNGGAAARPFRTHLNAFDQDMLLRIALELPLKRAVVGGIERVYEIGPIFRNEGVDSSHAAEFSMLEAYEAYGDYDSMASLVHDLVLAAAEAVGTTVVAARDGSTIDLAEPWREATLYGLVSDAVGAEIAVDTPAEVLRALAARHQVALLPGWHSGGIALELYEKLVEHTLIRPTFVRDFPESVKPLAKAHRRVPGLVEAFDLVVNGVELAAAYSELNDPVIQRERLVAQSLLAAQGDPAAMDVDEDFLRALEFGMPPAGGLGMGIDRLVMLLTGTGIREAMLFPLLRPE
ncbi:MAG TPA: lysine--tRNA ligase [Nocardioidaceae bacterium]|nr:lysine--tRNA ligase [Nocardioidaceae bacterium]